MFSFFASSSSSSSLSPTPTPIDALQGYVSLSPDRLFWTSIYDLKNISVYEVSHAAAKEPKFTISFNHNPFIAEYYSPGNVLFIVADTYEFSKSTIIIYDVVSKKPFNKCPIDIRTGNSICGLRVCGNNLLVITDSFIVLEQILLSRDEYGNLRSADLKFVSKEERSTLSPTPVYDTVVVGDVAYTVFLKDIPTLSQSCPPQQEKKGQSITEKYWGSYSPTIPASSSSAKTMFFIQKQYLKHGACTKLVGPYCVGNDIDSICIARDGKHVGFSYYGGRYLAVYGIEDNKLHVFNRGRNCAEINSISISDDNRYLTCTSNRGTAHVFDLSNSSSNVNSSKDGWVGSTVKMAGYYPVSFAKVHGRVGWKAFLVEDPQGQDLELVLISPGKHEIYQFDESIQDKTKLKDSFLKFKVN